MGGHRTGEPVDWRGLLKGYESTLYWPWCAFYGEILEAHPNAKVLLSVRDPEAWYESVANTIYGSPRPSTPPRPSH